MSVRLSTVHSVRCAGAARGTGDFQGKMAFGALRPVSVSAARQRLEAGAAKKRLKAGAARLVLADLG